MPERRVETSLPAGGQQPFVHPGVGQSGIDHAALHQAAQDAKRRRNALPKTQQPVAGGEGPAIPLLAGAPGRPGLTMAEHALSERGQAQPRSTGFVEPAVATAAPNRVAPSPAQLGILPTDELPPDARRDPNFIQGAGSSFASNQPSLALKYGVMRKGKLIPPQQLQQGSQGRLRPETVQDLEELARLQQKQSGIAVPEQEEQTDLGKAAGTVGDLPRPKLTDKERQEIQEGLNNLDEFDFDRYRQTTMRDILNNEEQKKIIEARLKPLDVGDIITNGYIVQRVPIVPNKLWVDFKTLDAETDLALKRIIMEDSTSVQVSNQYYLDKFGLMSVAAVVFRINDRPFGDITDEHGNFNDDKFRSKFSKVLKLPMPMLASLGVNAMWFDARVRQLFKAEEVGNG